MKKDKPEQDQEVQVEETKYSAAELIGAAEAAFGVKPEVVATALKVAKLSEATKAQAEAAIEKFMKKEVK